MAKKKKAPKLPPNHAAHPVCGHIKPLFAHRVSGPCDTCLTDIDREYGPQKHIMTWDDIRGARRPLLEATDWVETNAARVAREDPAFVQAVRDYREALFEISSQPDPENITWPVRPT